MKTVLRIISAICISLAFVSCGTINSVPVNNTSTSSSSNGYVLGSGKWLRGTVFQTISKHQALVQIPTSSSSYDKMMVLVVTPDSSKEYFFDDLAINGQYIFIGTCKYQTKAEFSKTVPVYIEKKYYVEGMEWDDWLAKIKTP